MKDENIRKFISELNDDEAIIFDNPYFDKSIIGIDEVSGSLIYDFDLMLEEYISDHNCEYEEALDMLCNDTIRLCDYLPKEGRPIILNRFDFID